MEQVIERTKARQTITAQAPARLDQARIDKRIRARLIDWPPDSCLHCRKPIVVDQIWTVVRTARLWRAFISLVMPNGWLNRRSPRVGQWGSIEIAV